MKTKDIKNILFPTDFSSESIRVFTSAVKFAEKNKARLIVLNVVDTLFNYNTENEPIELDLIMQDLMQFSKSKLKGMKEKIGENKNLKIETVTYTGETTEAIVRAVNHYNADLIIMATKITRDLFFKSSTFNIVKNTSVPLLSFLPGNINTNFKTILFPFNENFMTLQKVDEVLLMATLFKSKVVLLGISKANTFEKRQIITNNLIYLKSKFESNKINCEVHFQQSNNYSNAILDYCSDNKIDLVAIANNLPTYISENLASTFAKNVINHSNIPVLTVPVDVN